MIPNFKPTNIDPVHIDAQLPTLENANKQLDDYYDYIKNIVLGEGMGSLTSFDLEMLYKTLDDPRKYGKENISRLLTLFEQAASAERFNRVEDARECVRLITMFREEMDL